MGIEYLHLDSDLVRVSNYVDEIAREKTSLDRGAMALNVVMVPLIGFAKDIEDTRALDTTAVDDAWLAAVAGLPMVSRSGMQFISEALAEKGWVSIREAQQFVALEQRHQAEAQARVASEKLVSKAGASMLLARAERELPGTLQKVAEGVKDIAEGAAGLLSFSRDVAVITGKGLGHAARMFRKGTT